MQRRFFTIPIHGGEDTAEALNRFLAAERILAVERHLVQDGAASAWAIGVDFAPAGEGVRPAAARRGKVDDREVLSEADFGLYAQLRGLRKAIAEQEGVPVYAVFTNEQMAEMVTRRICSLTELREIPGVGEARTATGTRPTTATTTLASVVPELTTGVDASDLNRPPFGAPPWPRLRRRRNPMAPGA